MHKGKPRCIKRSRGRERDWFTACGIYGGAHAPPHRFYAFPDKERSILRHLHSASCLWIPKDPSPYGPSRRAEDGFLWHPAGGTAPRAISILGDSFAI